MFSHLRITLTHLCKGGIIMTIQSIARNQMAEPMMRVASGQRINSAADDAAGLAIVEDMTSQIRGLDQGTRNTMDMQALAQTAEGGLTTMADSMQRIRELGVQAANGTLSANQRDMIQGEIDQLSQGIQAAVNGTEFNTMNLLDGSAQGGLHTASGADGSGSTLVINDMSSIAQAVSSFNVTGYSFDVNQAGEEVSRAAFDFSEIDDALTAVTAGRANLGAAINTFDYTASANTVSSLNLADSRSRIADADIAQEMMAFNQERVINEMQLLMQQQQRDQMEQQGQMVAGMTGA